MHADWGSDPKKRWMCCARIGDSGYEVTAPELVGDLSTFWRRLGDRSQRSRIVVGFDFPIGVPGRFASLAGIAHFPAALRRFGVGEWSEFYDIAERPEEINIRRPFYPRRPGGTKHAHLLEGIGVQRISELLRRCEQPTLTRGAASPLFWTLGGKQVGRAAMIGWRDVLVPGLEEVGLRLWPFDGTLQDMIASPGCVAVETYPAEACLHLGFTPPGRGWSKTSQVGRSAQSPHILTWAQHREVTLAPELVEMIESGFGPRPDAEDPFDATLGALSMLEVILGHRSPGVPHDRAVRSVEGWILGQKDDQLLRLAL